MLKCGHGKASVARATHVLVLTSESRKITDVVVQISTVESSSLPAPCPARCVVVSSGVAQPLRVDSGRGSSPRGDPPRACALYHGEQRGGDQDVGEERDARSEG